MDIDFSKAKKICRRTKEILEKNILIPANLHSSFKHVCNLITDNGDFIPLISKDVPMQVMSIKLDISEFQNFENTRFELFLSDFESTEIWNPEPHFLKNIISETEIISRLEKIKYIILKYGKLEGLGSLVTELYSENHNSNIYCDFAKPRIIKLLDAVKNNDTGNISRYAKKIIGFGIGLTPSADDFLAGFMLSAIYLKGMQNKDLSKIKNINKNIVSDMNTTKVSSEMLKFAAIGESSENVRDFFLSFFGGTEDALFISAKSVLENGSTSGTDCLAGIYTGIRSFIDF